MTLEAEYANYIFLLSKNHWVGEYMWDVAIWKDVSKEKKKKRQLYYVRGILKKLFLKD